MRLILEIDREHRNAFKERVLEWLWSYSIERRINEEHRKTREKDAAKVENKGRAKHQPLTPTTLKIALVVPRRSTMNMRQHVKNPEKNKPMILLTPDAPFVQTKKT